MIASIFDFYSNSVCGLIVRIFFAPFGKNRLMNPDERYEAITGHPQKILQKGVHSIVRFPVMKPL